MMHIDISQETRVDEIRAAMTPETVKKYMVPSHRVTVQSGVGVTAAQPDEAYVTASVRIGTTAEALDAQIVLKACSPEVAELAQMQLSTVLADMLNPFDDEDAARLAVTNVATFVLEVIPRTTRA